MGQIFFIKPATLVAKLEKLVYDYCEFKPAKRFNEVQVVSKDISGSEVYNTIADALEERKSRKDRRTNQDSNSPYSDPSNDRRSGKDRRDG